MMLFQGKDYIEIIVAFEHFEHLVLSLPEIGSSLTLTTIEKVCQIISYPHSKKREHLAIQGKKHGNKANLT
jgi:hypothetical protein